MDEDQVIKDLKKIRKQNGSNDWKPFMVKYHCQIICEIGVQIGVNFSQMIMHDPKVAVAVDSWINDGVISRNDGGYSQVILNEQFKKFKESVINKPFVKICHDYSFNAVKDFEDNYFDLVYVDGDHTYEGCLGDLDDWFSKIKSGGYLLGDDYRESRYTRVSFGVIEAVNDFAHKNNLKFYELPRYGWAIIKK